MTASFAALARTSATASLALCVALSSALRPAAAALPVAQKTILTRFLTSLQHQQYDVAFALLSKPEKSYFASAANYASAYTADRVKIDSFQILGSTVAGGITVAIVAEKFEFFEPKRQAVAIVSAKVPYGIVNVGGALGIKDPYHPWRAIAPENWSVTTSGVTATVRKIAFFTGRVELTIAFDNRSESTVTLLPYGRSVVRDQSGAVHQPIETKLQGLTDAELYKGVLLQSGARYTGTMTFFTANRFAPTSLSVTLAPMLADGADAPFNLELPTYVLPK
jgi:hypothetical protein